MQYTNKYNLFFYLFILLLGMSSVTLAGLKATSEAPINQQPLFSYAAGYPPLGVTSGGGTVSPNWNIFAVGVVTAGSTPSGYTNL
jgi:hypothetical protein